MQVQLTFPPRVTFDYVAYRVKGLEDCGRNQYVAWCPAHADEGTSLKGLSVSVRPDGKCLLYCHSGCTFAEITNALETVEPADEIVFEPHTQYTGSSTDDMKRTAAYGYRNEDGKLLYVILRFEDEEGNKTFRRIWKTRERRSILFRLDRLQGHHECWMTEGEKDAKRLLEMDVLCTCNPSGANSWHPSYMLQLRCAGIKKVNLIRDKDTAGKRHALTVWKDLTSNQIECDVWEAREGKDLSDHLDAGYVLEDLEPVNPLA